jgi:hypothetical protein
MSTLHPTEDHHEPERYEIRIKGHLEPRWADWFEGLSITLDDNGETVFTGPVVDQAALHGLLRKVRDLGLPLVAVIRLDPRPTVSPDENADSDHNRSNKETNT